MIKKYENVYGEQVEVSDFDALLIDKLGNLNLHEGLIIDLNKDFPTRNCCYPVYKIKHVKDNYLTGFNAAILVRVGENGVESKEKNGLLWVDGSKGFNNLLPNNLQKIKNYPITIEELMNDWVINDVFFIGQDEIPPQLKDLKEFADEYKSSLEKGIGVSLAGVMLSALAFTKGYEDVQFSTYSGCVSENLLAKVKRTWGLNNANGANLVSYTNSNEPLTKLYEPVHLANKIYMLDNLRTNKMAHGAKFYISDAQNSDKVSFHEIKRFNSKKYPVWKLCPRISLEKSPIGNGFQVKISCKVGSDEHAIETIKNVSTVLKENSLNKYSVLLDDTDFVYKINDISKPNKVTKEVKSSSQNAQENFPQKSEEQQNKTSKKKEKVVKETTTKHKSSSSTNEHGRWITTKQGNKVFIEDALIEDLKWYYPELEDIPKEDEEIEELNSNSKEVDENPPLSIMQKGLQMEENPNNEYWYLPNIPLTKVGVFPYYGQQISPNLEPDKLYMVYRPAEEIGSEEALKTLELLPVVEDHAMLGTRPGMMLPEEKGIQGITGTNIYCENGVVYGDIKIFTEYLKNVINSGKHEISMGYFCDYDYSSGYYNGQRYDVIQRNLRGNHIAIVDKGRMGEEVCIPQMYNQGVYDGVNTRILVADETVVYSSEVQSSYRSLEEQWQAYLRGE